MAMRQQFLNYCGTDKTGCAGDKNTHVARSPICIVTDRPRFEIEGCNRTYSNNLYQVDEERRTKIL